VPTTDHHAVATDFGVANALNEASGKSSLTSGGRGAGHARIHGGASAPRSAAL